MPDLPNYKDGSMQMYSPLAKPSMQQDQHPDHNMPVPEHDGTTLGTGDYISKLKETNASNYSIQSGK